MPPSKAFITGGNASLKGFYSLTILLQPMYTLLTVSNSQLFRCAVPKKVGFKKHTQGGEGEYWWLENTDVFRNPESNDGLHTKPAIREPGDWIITPTAPLPLVQYRVHTAVMNRHSMNVVKRAMYPASEYLTNSILTFDQSVYTLAKTQPVEVARKALKIHFWWSLVGSALK